MAELVDAPDLGSGAARCESSSLSFRTIIQKAHIMWAFLCLKQNFLITNAHLNKSTIRKRHNKSALNKEETAVTSGSNYYISNLDVRRFNKQNKYLL